MDVVSAESWHLIICIEADLRWNWYICVYKEGIVMKRKTSATENLFREHRSYSPDEVIAAGGTTAFGIKMGKDRDTMLKALENAPKPEPFTEEEWAEMMAD